LLPAPRVYVTGDRNRSFGAQLRESRKRLVRGEYVLLAPSIQATFREQDLAGLRLMRVAVDGDSVLYRASLSDGSNTGSSRL
jgi:hypothetical protein